MKKGVIIVVLLGMLLVLPLVLAQEKNQSQGQTQQQGQTQAQTYSGFNRFIDNVKLTFSGGDNKVRQALEIREKEVNSAINNIQNQEEDKAIKNLERAKKKLEIVQEKVSLDTSEEIKTSAEEITDKINTNEALPEIFEDYLLEEEKTILVAELTEKTFEYCTELAKEDFGLMLEEEICNPETAVPGLEEKLKELKDIQQKSFVKLMLEIRSCIDDPGTCNCEVNVEDSEKAKCEKMVALAVKCEYKDDEASCNELEAMKPSPGDGFARSFVPDWLMDLFGQKYKMIEYGIQPSDRVPEECWDENDKPECDKYDDLKENNLDWDEYGNYRPILHPGKKPSRGGTKETLPTIQESVPECFDENGNFLEEKCGKITVVWTEDGLINYIVEKQVDDIVDKFENMSRQYMPGTYANGTIDIEGKVIDEENWTVNEGELTVSNKAREIKRDMNQITKQIKDITYGPGTGPGGDADKDVNNVVVNGDENGGDTGVVVDGDDVAPGPQGIVGVVDNDVVVDGDGGYASGTSAGGDDGVSDGGNNVVSNDIVDGDGSGTVDSGTVDNGGDSGNGNDVSGVDEGPGEPGVVDED